MLAFETWMNQEALLVSKQIQISDQPRAELSLRLDSQSWCPQFELALMISAAYFRRSHLFLTHQSRQVRISYSQPPSFPTTVEGSTSESNWGASCETCIPIGPVCSLITKSFDIYPAYHAANASAWLPSHALFIFALKYRQSRPQVLLISRLIRRERPWTRHRLMNFSSEGCLPRCIPLVHLTPVENSRER